MGLTAWSGFLLAAVLIAVSPGPGAAISMSSGLRYGYLATVPTIAGLQMALLLQLLIIVLGLGLLLMTSSLAFSLLKFFGAAYLVWLGIQKWRENPLSVADLIVGKDKTILPKQLFIQGLLVNLTNPKAILFMTAFVPQFIDLQRPQVLQFLIIAATLCGVDILVMSSYALLASRLRPWLSNPKAIRAQNFFFGSIFMFAGILLALSGNPVALS